MKNIFVLFSTVLACLTAQAEKVLVDDPFKQIEIVSKYMAQRGDVNIKALYSNSHDNKGYWVSLDLVYKNTGHCQIENLREFWEDTATGETGFTWLLNGGQDCRN